MEIAYVGTSEQTLVTGTEPYPQPIDVYPGYAESALRFKNPASEPVMLSVLNVNDIYGYAFNSTDGAMILTGDMAVLDRPSPPQYANSSGPTVDGFFVAGYDDGSFYTTGNISIWTPVDGFAEKNVAFPAFSGGISSPFPVPSYGGANTNHNVIYMVGNAGMQYILAYDVIDEDNYQTIEMEGDEGAIFVSLDSDVIFTVQPNIFNQVTFEPTAMNAPINQVKTPLTFSDHPTLHETISQVGSMSRAFRIGVYLYIPILVDAVGNPTAEPYLVKINMDLSGYEIINVVAGDATIQAILDDYALENTDITFAGSFTDGFIYFTGGAPGGDFLYATLGTPSPPADNPESNYQLGDVIDLGCWSPCPNVGIYQE